MNVVFLLVALLLGLVAGGLVAYRTMVLTGRAVPRRAVRELEEIYEGLRTAHAIQLATFEVQESLIQRRQRTLPSDQQGFDRP